MGIDRWVFAKELVLVLAAFFALAGTRRIGWIPRWTTIWAVGTAVVLGASAILGDAPLPQLIGRWPRYEGIVSLGVYVLAAYLGARLLGGRRADVRVAKRGEVFLAYLAAGFLAAAVISALEVVGIHPIPSDLVRPGSLLGNASDLGVVSVVGCALFLPRLAEAWSAGHHGRALASPIVGATASLTTLVMSGSRAALVSAGLCILLHVILGIRLGERRLRWWLALGLGSVFSVIALILTPASLGRFTGEVANAYASAVNRFDVWGTSLRLIVMQPATGVGPNGFADAVTALAEPDWSALLQVGGWLESPHSVILQVGSSAGLLGFALAGSLVWFTIRQLLRNGPSGPFGWSGVVALGAAGLTLLVHFTAPGPMILICLIAGATIATPAAFERKDARARSELGRIPKLLMLSAWAVALTLAILADHQLKDGVQRLGDAKLEAAERSRSFTAALTALSEIPHFCSASRSGEFQ